MVTIPPGTPTFPMRARSSAVVKRNVLKISDKAKTKRKIAFGIETIVVSKLAFDSFPFN